ncbi:hypothetical protein [Metabacillus sp. FJAT-52054]|uniref:Uncharacterized protein n=2 Tax=Bacillaceae TaxID=186817 RepID=A0ABZ2NKB4_9BACI
MAGRKDGGIGWKNKFGWKERWNGRKVGEPGWYQGRNGLKME